MTIEFAPFLPLPFLAAFAVMAHGVLARAYAATRKYDLAMAESERALEINPSDAEVLRARAAVLLWTGRIEEAIATAEIANRLNPNIGPEAALNLGIAYLLSGRYADAVRLLEETPQLVEIFGATFVRTYRAIKETEYREYFDVISPWERRFLLLHV